MSVLPAERQNSPSPSRRLSLGVKISAFGARLNRSLGGQGDRNDDEDEDDYVSPILRKDADRSTSRGREPFISSGRGGLGNIRQTSLSRDARPDSGPDDFSHTRGREHLPNPKQLYSTGRGGAGNIRSPSRDAKPVTIDSSEQTVIDGYVASKEGAPVSTGRGGLGNIAARSRSREPSATRNLISTGRGGAGNIVTGDGSLADIIDEDERRKFSSSKDGYHSTGRGGIANLTDGPQPPVESAIPHSGPYESTGRGGAGNIIRERSSSRRRND